MHLVPDKGQLWLGRPRDAPLTCAPREVEAAISRRKEPLLQEGPSGGLFALDMAFEHALARLEVPGDISKYASKIWTACESAICDSTHKIAGEHVPSVPTGVSCLQMDAAPQTSSLGSEREAKMKVARAYCISGLGCS